MGLMLCLILRACKCKSDPQLISVSAGSRRHNSQWKDSLPLPWLPIAQIGWRSVHSGSRGRIGTSLAVHYEATSLTNGGSSGSIHFLTPHTPAAFSLTSFSSRTPHMAGRRASHSVGGCCITNLVKLAAINMQSVCQGRGEGAGGAEGVMHRRTFASCQDDFLHVLLDVCGNVICAGLLGSISSCPLPQ